MTRCVYLVSEHRDCQPQGAMLRRALREACKAAFEHLCLPDDFSFTLLCTGDREIRELNHTFRGKDKPTNVLSFAAEGEEGYLGDIVLSMDTLAREAAEQGKPLRDHFIHLVVHALLHLLGHDHEEDGEAEIMEAEEIEILQHLGIGNPYL